MNIFFYLETAVNVFNFVHPFHTFSIISRVSASPAADRMFATLI